MLIDPASEIALAQRDRFDGLRRYRYVPHLGLQVIAGQSDGHEVSIVDERCQSIDPATVSADLVGITARTAQAPRAHQLARVFSGRGIPVVLGGPYVTLTPGLALRDPAIAAVVIGPGAGVWKDVLADVASGRLKKTYHGQPSPTMEVSRRDLPHCRYRPSVALLQITQGCNFNCKFCVIPQLYERRFVMPEVDTALQHIADLDVGLIVFVDDNLIGNLPYARRLFAGLHGMGKRWMCQCTLNVARDDSMLSLMSDAGCVMVNIGLESLTPKTWEHQRKRQNGCCEYTAAIRRLHDHGILVSGGFIFGFDEDEPSVFDRSLDFMDKSRIDIAACHVLTPYPGLPFYEQLKREGRILTGDLSRYTTYDVVFRPRRMTPDQLQEGFERVVRTFYSLKGIAARYCRAAGMIDVLFSTVFGFGGLVVRSNLRRGLPMHA